MTRAYRPSHSTLQPYSVGNNDQSCGARLAFSCTSERRITTLAPIDITSPQSLIILI